MFNSESYTCTCGVSCLYVINNNIITYFHNKKQKNKKEIPQCIAKNTPEVKMAAFPTWMFL